MRRKGLLKKATAPGKKDASKSAEGEAKKIEEREKSASKEDTQARTELGKKKK